MVLSTIADHVLRTVDSVQDTVSETFFEPTIRLGVTGLSRSGKTVFITSLVANMLDRGRMTHFLAAQEGRIEAVYLQPQPDDTVARFEYETHLNALGATPPAWPESTRAISELRLSFKVRPNGLLAGLQQPRTVHLDIVDYPGEWLLDLGLLDKSYQEWSAQVLQNLPTRLQAKDYLSQLEGLNVTKPLDEPIAQGLAHHFTNYLQAAQADGFYDCTPGRFLLPGDLAGSPVLTFAPLPPCESAPRKSLYKEMERRFEAYKSRVVKPFFRDHFSRIDRQVVLMDTLGAIHNGPQALEDMRHAIGDILAAFRPGSNAFLSRVLRGKRVEKILFAATKADHIHHSQHARLNAIMQAMVRSAQDRAQFAGAKTSALALASVRATTQSTVKHNGETLNMVRGTLLDSAEEAAFYPGELPEDPNELLSQARSGADEWLDQDYQVMRFSPPQAARKPGDGPAHIWLDRAAEFLIGDKL